MLCPTKRLATIWFAAVTGRGPAHKPVGHTLRLLIILLLAGSVSADWVSSGPMTYYDAEIGRTKVVGGGPLRNYLDGDVWREVNPDFRMVGNWLVSDSGYHRTGVNLTTNTVWLNWRDHYLGLSVAPLYALRLSTLDYVKLADPNFTDRSFTDNKIFVTDVYPGVDLEIENSADGIRHLYRFHQSARDQIETWWQNHGQLDDIWIVNTFQLNIDSLNCSWSDNVGSFTVDQPRVIKLPVQISGAETPFWMTGGQVELESSEYPRLETLHHRLLLVGSSVYLAEGFKWADIRQWEDGTINHPAVFGNQSTSSGNGVIVAAYGISDPTYQYTASTGDVITEVWVHSKSYSGAHTFDVGVYDVDGSDRPDDSLGAATISASVGTEDDYGTTGLSWSMSNGITYTLAIANGTNGARMYYNTETSGDHSLQTDPHLNATWVHFGDGDKVARIWAVYTTGGGGPAASTRRRHISLKGI